MSLPLIQLRPISTAHYYLSGDVTIQDGAAIAPGVLLQAEAGSKIIIKSGACIGIGSILHVETGVLEVGEGANIGAEVLLIGTVSIGANSCIGAACTIVNQNIDPGCVIPPGSLIGDQSRPVAVPANTLQATDTVELPDLDLESELGERTPEVPPSSASVPTDLAPNGINVYGQLYVNQLRVKLFPRQMDSEPKLSKPSLPDDPWDD